VSKSNWECQAYFLEKDGIVVFTFPVKNDGFDGTIGVNHWLNLNQIIQVFNIIEAGGSS